MGAAKVLVVGAIQGQLKKAFDKIAKLHAKQDFAICLIAGDVFGDGDDAKSELSELLTGALKVPLPTYFSIGDQALPSEVREKLESSDEACSNLVFLGRKGTFTTSEGIRIVSVGGRLVQNEASVTQAIGKYDPLFLESEARALHGAHTSHILLTNQWPSNITRLSSIDPPETIEEGAQCLATLNLALKPWYHFSSSPAACWEREPFKHPDEYNSDADPQLTRFKSAASVSAPNKEWMTAFTLDTTRPPTAPTSTAIPFLRGSPPRKRSAPQDSPSDAYTRYTHQNNIPRGPKRQRQHPRHYIPPTDCFMCLNKPSFKTHMVASIGDESMVTVLRGPLPLPTTFPELSFTGHAMIIPHYHAADEAAQGRRNPSELDVEFTEMTRFRKALNSMIAAKSNGRLGTVCTEVNRTGIRHLHWQVMAMEASKIKRGVVEAAFKVVGEKYQYAPFQECKADELLEEQRNDFCRVWLWTPSNAVDRAALEADGMEMNDEGVTKSLFFPVSPNQDRFYVWYPREVCAGLLQLEDRTNWMDTLLSNDAEELKAEEVDAEGLKADFAHFDFAMQ